MEFLCFSFEFDNDDWLVIRSRFNFEWPQLHIFLDNWIIELSPDKSLCIEDGVSWILCDLILCSISDKSLSISEGNVRRGGPVSLIIGDDLNSLILPDAHTRISRPEIDSDSFADCFLFSHFNFYESLGFATNLNDLEFLEHSIILLAANKIMK